VGGDGQAVSDTVGAPKLPPRPTPPRPEDCCGSGCARCIYEIYDDAMLTWEREVARIIAEASKSGDAGPGPRPG
jgi:Oxidoreductase-like protein, N-terminal